MNLVLLFKGLLGIYFVFWREWEIFCKYIGNIFWKFLEELGDDGGEGNSLRFGFRLIIL